MSSNPFDPATVPVEPIKRADITPQAMHMGIGNDVALDRILFRLHFIEKAFEKRKQTLANGNIAVLEQEIYITNHLIQDLIDVVREAITLCAVSAFRQEQGVASPPNPPAIGAENPPSPPLDVDASALESGAGQGQDVKS